MIVIHASNPDEALQKGLIALSEDHIYTESRNGPVLRFPTPVTTVWTNPLDRISLMPVRDANPFFHLVEAYWMLAGRNDVKTVAEYASTIGSYSDDGVTLWGAYGYRWRNHFGIDQIQMIIDELKVNRSTRRCVLQMWDGREELIRGKNNGKDLCCNTAVYFDPQGNTLNMTVTNRSNDMVLGAYGANVVHMSVLLEYIAAQAGFEVGTYYQVSNNLHFYTELTPLMKRLATYADGKLEVSREVIDYQRPYMKVQPLFQDLASVGMSNDMEFVLRANAVLSGDVNDSRGFYALNRAIQAYECYKTQGAAGIVEAYIEETETLYPWDLAEKEWLARRPSYKRSVEIYDEVQDIWVPVAAQSIVAGQEFRFTYNRSRSFVAKGIPTCIDGNWLVQGVPSKELS